MVEDDPASRLCVVPASSTRWTMLYLLHSVAPLRNPRRRGQVQHLSPAVEVATRVSSESTQKNGLSISHSYLLVIRYLTMTLSSVLLVLCRR